MALPVVLAVESTPSQAQKRGSNGSGNKGHKYLIIKFGCNNLESWRIGIYGPMSFDAQTSETRDNYG